MFTKTIKQCCLLLLIQFATSLAFLYSKKFKFYKLIICSQFEILVLLREFKQSQIQFNFPLSYPSFDPHDIISWVNSLLWNTRNIISLHKFSLTKHGPCYINWMKTFFQESKGHYRECCIIWCCGLFLFLSLFLHVQPNYYFLRSYTFFLFREINDCVERPDRKMPEFSWFPQDPDRTNRWRRPAV